MSLHLLLVANWMIFLVYEDNDFRHASIHFFEAIELSQLPSLHQKRRRIFPKFSAPSFLLLTTINHFRDLFPSSSPRRNSRIRYAFRPPTMTAMSNVQLWVRTTTETSCLTSSP